VSARRLLAVVLLAIVGPAGCAPSDRLRHAWWDARRDSSEQAPVPATTPEPVVQVYAARAVSWRGVFAVHTWIVLKPRDAERYTRYEVIGWGVDSGTPAVRTNRTGPDNYWFGARPDLLVEHRGEGVEAMIGRIEAAVRAYPYPTSYRTWPGPNSNTFTAYVARAVPELRLSLPATAIGKDYLPAGALAARSPSGTGVQVSVLGVAGMMAGLDEGLELNVLGLTFGVAVKPPGLKLPIVGRVP
jgi:hypothetical protein